MRESIVDLAQGRWREILRHFGVSPSFLVNKHGPCPFCGGKDRYRFDDKDGKGTFFCSQCGAGTGFTFLEKLKGWDFKTSATEIRKILGTLSPPISRKRRTPPNLRELMRKLWVASAPLQKNDIADTYLQSRGITIGPETQNLRTCAEWPYPGTKVTRYLPVMLALLQNGSGEIVMMHQTFLKPDGSGKADVEKPRLFLPGEIPGGVAVPLFAPAAHLGIAEGIETALSAAQMFDLPVWPTLNTSLMGKWKAPEGVSRVTIFGDTDDGFGGQAAAYETARQLSVASRDLKIDVKLPERGDWNDEFQRHPILSG